MNRAAVRSYPFQVIQRFMINRPGDVFYIGGNDILPAPLPAEREAEVIAMLGTEKEKEAKAILIEHNLRLVVYIAKKFDNTGVSVEDLISIGTIGLIKAINTFNPVKNIKLATYASRCIENEILMYLRRNSKTKMEVSIDEPLNVDWDGNELLLSDILGTDDDVISRRLEDEVEIALLGKAISKLTKREQMIIRLRFGIGSDFPRGGQIDYVLGHFTDEDWKTMDERLEMAGEIIKSFCLAGIDITMNQFNKK